MRVSLLDPSGPAARENARVSGVLLDPVSYWRSRPALPRSVAGEALGVGAPGMVTIKGGEIGRASCRERVFLVV